MKDAVLSALFKIPDPITADEFSRRTGKTESAVRHMMDRRLLPMVTEREVLGPDGSTRRLLILWNEWLEMVHEATSKLPLNDRTGERVGSRKPINWRMIWA